MNTANTTTTLQALDAIFDKPVTVQSGTVKVTLEKEVTPEQFAGLAQLSYHEGLTPGVVRSGAGVSVVFN